MVKKKKKKKTPPPPEPVESEASIPFFTDLSEAPSVIDSLHLSVTSSEASRQGRRKHGHRKRSPGKEGEGDDARDPSLIEYQWATMDARRKREAEYVEVVVRGFLDDAEVLTKVRNSWCLHSQKRGTVTLQPSASMNLPSSY